MGSFFVGLTLTSLLSKADKAKAYGTITNLTTSVADTTKSATTTYTVSFTIQNSVPASSGRINVQLYGPSQKNYSRTNFDNATVATGTSPTTLSLYSRNWDGVTLTTSSAVAAGTTITLKIGNVVNASMGGKYFFHVWTSNYSTDIDGTSAWGGNYNSSSFDIGNKTNLTGTITNASGTAIPFAYIYLNNANWSSYLYTYSDVNGVYGFGDVPADTYSFNLYAPPNQNSNATYFPPPTSSVTIPSSGVTTKNLSFLAATKTLSGKITKDTSLGAAVTDANVYVSRAGGNGWASTTTDSSGNYSFNLTGGRWSINISPKNWPADWSWTGANETITFADDATSESQTKNFTVDSVNATVKGKVVKSDGSAPTQYSVGLSFNNSKSQWFSAQVNADGTFNAKLSASTYSVSGWVSDNSLSLPKIDNFTVGERETKDLGTITLVAKKDLISGTVKDNLGKGVAGASVSAWKSGDGSWDWGSATTDSSGNYSIKVTPGSWQVSAWPQWNSGYIYSGQPIAITVTSGVAATANFTFQKATATINGLVTDPNGNTLTSLYAWANASDGSQNWSNIGASVERGTFTLKVPAGTWEINVYLYGNDYGSPDPVKVTISNNETKSVTLKALKNDATIQGTVYDESGNKVTGKWISIHATKGKYGSWQSANLDQSNATYSLKVSAGTWNLGWWIDQNLGYSSGNGQDVSLTVGSGENKTYDIKLKKADSTISGKATKSDGSAMQWAWITADTRDPNEKKSADTYYYSNGASSNNNGDYSMKLPAGTYWVGGSMWPGSGYINPKREKVTIDSNHSATVNLVFRKTDSSISGVVKKDGGGTDAFVTAWSEDGGYSEANSNYQGNYSLSLSSSTKWHLRAVKASGTDIYKSKETIVDLTGATTATQDLDLSKQNFTLPKSLTLTFDPTKQQTIKLDDGTVITVPANAIANSGTITFTVEPDASLAEQSDAKPIAYGYNLKVVDQNGKEITSFKDNVTIENKYQQSWLDEAKVLNENELVPAYWDESVGTWKELSNVTVNKDDNTVTYQTNHFTRFALVAASDTTPPSSPANISATDMGGFIRVSWTNPTESDFSSIKIYRSEESGKLGDALYTGLTETSKDDDKDLVKDKTYYYTVRALDKSTNESTNTTQVSATSTNTPATTLPKTGGTDKILVSPWYDLLFILLIPALKIALSRK